MRNSAASLKIVLSLLITLLMLSNIVAIPEIHAATSRVAVISSLNGDVQVKKAGGSKTFKAFARMSLNEGDILTTGASGTAKLKFANGTDEDDTMTVGKSTTITFSKLSNRSGTRTKVSMQQGAAWVDVKSIQNEDDEFTLETPTSIMGVRGTHFLLQVGQDGMSYLSVAAGVVHTDDREEQGANEQNVYPTQTALMTSGNDGYDVTVAPLDPETLLQDNDSILLEAIFDSSEDIIEENREYVKRYETEGLPDPLGDSPSDAATFKVNTEQLIGLIAGAAVDQGVLDEAKAGELAKKIQNTTGIVIDLNRKMELTEEQRQLQQLLKQKAEEAKQQAEIRRQKDEEQRRQNEALLNEQKAKAEKKEEANRKAKEEAKEKAEAAYLKQLPEAEKKRYENDKSKAQATSPSPSPSESESDSPSPSPKSSDARLSHLRLMDGNTEVALAPEAFDPDTAAYEVQIDYSVAAVAVIPERNERHAAIKVNDIAIESGTSSGLIPLTPEEPTEIKVLVEAEDGVTTRAYTITVTREAPSHEAYLTDLKVNGATVNGFNSNNTAYDLGTVGYEASNMSVTYTASDLSTVTVTGNDPIDSLQVGENVVQIVVTAEDGVTTTTYTVKVTRLPEPSHEAYLTDLKVNGAKVNGFDPTNTAYDLGTVGYEATNMSVTYTASDLSTVTVTGNDPIDSLHVGENVVQIVVTAEDGVTTTTYTVKVTRLPGPSHEAYLTDLKVNGATINGFDPTNTAYNLGTVINEMSKLSVTYSVYNQATVSVNGTVPDYPLIVGSNEIQITVTAEDGETTRMYTLTVKREPSHEANLTGLWINGAEIDVSVTDEVYLDDVNYTTSTLSISSTASSQATISALGNISNYGIVPGTNSFTITVTAEDGTTVHEYHFWIKRKPSLSVIYFNDAIPGTGWNGYQPDVYEYHFEVQLASGRSQLSSSWGPAPGCTVGWLSNNGILTAPNGVNVFTIEPISADGTISQVYTFYVYWYVPTA